MAYCTVLYGAWHRFHVYCTGINRYGICGTRDNVLGSLAAFQPLDFTTQLLRLATASVIMQRQTSSRIHADFALMKLGTDSTELVVLEPLGGVP